MRLASAVAVVAAFVLAAPALAGAQVDLDRLQVEKKAEPVGIDVDRPRFSWIDRVARARGRAAVLPAARRDSESARRGRTVWDSGVVHVGGVGERGVRRAAARAADRVRVGGRRRDHERRHGARLARRSAPASTTATTGPAARGSATPGADQGDALTLDGASWIWTPEATDPPPAEDRGVPHHPHVTPAGKTATAAEILITADDSFRLWVNGARLGSTSGAENEWQQSHRFETDAATPTATSSPCAPRTAPARRPA